MTKVKNTDDLWYRAAVIGGLWASIEIIIGSFLHNAKIPFAGSILAFFGTILLIGFYQLWPYKGLIIRAGLITAVMKSVSPSAIILGPMTGIFLEALLIEFTILLLGRNIPSYLISGFLSVSSALIHKIISLIIVYGFNIIKIYVNIINFGLKQIGIHEASDIQVLFFLLGFYFLFGVTGGWLGYKTGKKAARLRLKHTFTFSDTKINYKNSNDFFSFNSARPGSIPLLLLHMLVIPLALLLVNSHYFDFGYTIIGLYIVIFGIIYRKSLRKLRKPVFWSQLIIIVILSALFWKFGKADHRWFSMDGLWVGLEMMIRALFILIGFSALSIELRNKKVKSFITNAGFGKFYGSLEMAFSALPQMIAMLPTPKEFLKAPGTTLLKPMAMADQWLAFFKKEK